MIEKRADYIQSSDDQEIFTLLPETREDTSGFTKTAEYASEVANFLDSLEREPGFVYALANALTAGEYYGPNRNGDYFPEDALKKHHKTFEEHGHVYKHHVNKDPKKSMGKVIFSYYNPRMHRVETVIKLQKSHKDVKEIIENIAKGMAIKLSMGCKVPYDVCSITGKKAKTRKEYSDYLRYKMNKILDDGRRVYAINTKPRFFDLSIVTIPADPLAAIMTPIGFGKLAEKTSETENTTTYNNSYSESLGKAASAKTADDKKATLVKEIIGGDVDSIEEDPKKIIHDSQGNFTNEQIEKLSQYPLNEVLSTFAGLRIFPKREDFQKLALYSAGRKKLADRLDKIGHVFTVDMDAEIKELSNIGPDFVNEKIANEIKSSIPDLSLTKPAIINRIIEKSANFRRPSRSVYPTPEERERSMLSQLFFSDEPKPENDGTKSSLPTMLAVGTLYAGYASIFKDSANPSTFTKFVGKHPWLAPLAGIGMGAVIDKEQKDILDPVNKEIFNKNASRLFASPIEKTLGTFLVAAPASYYYSAKSEAKARRGEPISEAEDFVRRNPLLTAIGGTTIARSIGRGIGNTLDDAKSSLKSFTDKHKKSRNPAQGINFEKDGSIDNLNPETINIIYKELIS